MRLLRLSRLLSSWASDVMRCRPPDQLIGRAGNPYMSRWFVLPKNRALNVYLHRFHRSDDDRALHDHPWPNLSLILQGAYDEHCIRAGGVEVRTRRRAGNVKLRGPRAAHRIELLGGAPVKTLFITGPKLREWGFHCPQGWRHWRDFTADDTGNTVGRGCA